MSLWTGLCLAGGSEGLAMFVTIITSPVNIPTYANSKQSSASLLRKLMAMKSGNFILFAQFELKFELAIQLFIRS